MERHAMDPRARAIARGDRHVGAAAHERDQLADLGGRVRVIGIHRDEHVIIHRAIEDPADARPEAGAEPLVPAVGEDRERQAAPGLRHGALRLGPRAVCAAVVHEHDAERLGADGERALEIEQQPADHPLLVPSRQQHPDHDRSSAGMTCEYSPCTLHRSCPHRSCPCAR